MSLITTCPECATSFHVKPEHLSAHRGDVRCGKCNLVFNALDKLTQTPDLPLPVASALPEVEEILPSDISSETIQEPSVEVRTDKELPIDEPFVIIEPEITAHDVEDAIIADEPSQDIDIYEEVLIEPESSEPVFVEPALAKEIEPEAPQPADIIEEVAETPAPEDSPAIIDEASVKNNAAKAPKSFLDAAPKNKLHSTNAQRKVPKSVLALLIGLLILASLAQATYYLRSPIALKFPVLKPYLVSACGHLGCKIELPKDATLLLVDDSNLQEDAEHAGVIHLSSTLINNAEFAMAYPLLELTLTDANDKPLLRRTFKPSEYLVAGTKVNDGIPAGEEVHIKLSLIAADTPVSGYRVFVTY